MSVGAVGVSNTPPVKIADISAASVTAAIKSSDAGPPAAAATAGAVAPADGRRSKRRSAAADIVAEMKSVTDRLHNCAFDPENVDVNSARTIVKLASEYESILFGLLAENARLKGCIEGFERSGGCFPPAVSIGRVPPTASVPVPVVEAIVL
ncbi:uncharacterized protein ACN2A1_001251 isoform 1-T2 [Glossina fuscipes fuscipes]